MILLDTNVVSEPLRHRPDQKVVAWLDRQPLETLCLSTPTVAELRFGIAALPDGRRRDVLEARLEQTVLPLFEGRILTFDLPATAAYGRLRSSARRDGSSLGDFDALIAASTGCTVATRDEKPFRALGLPVLNPFA